MQVLVGLETFLLIHNPDHFYAQDILENPNFRKNKVSQIFFHFLR